MPLHRGFAQSNGLVERTVQTAKKPLKKTYEDNKNPYSGVYFTKYFLEMVFLPLSLLMGRRTEASFLQRIPC